MSLNAHELALTKAKIGLTVYANSAFFTTIAYSVNHVFDETIKTAQTDGLSISYNPEYFMSLTSGARISLILHETMHIAYKHSTRAKESNYDFRKFNIAADYVINGQLKEQSFEVPSNWLYNKKYQGLSTEQIYKQLPSLEKLNYLGDIFYDLKPSKDNSKEVSNKIDRILIKAATQAKLEDGGIGKIPGEIQIYLDKLLNPKLPWQIILRKYLFSISKDDYSFKKPNKRYFPQHILPSLHSTNGLTVAIFVDISLSVSEKEFTTQITEIASILKNIKIKEVTLGLFDTEIKSTQKITTIKELLNIKFVGRGGTAIKPVLDWTKNNKPELLLVFSDGYFYVPDTKLNIPTLWLIYNNLKFKPNFGKVINYMITD